MLMCTVQNKIYVFSGGWCTGHVTFGRVPLMLTVFDGHRRSGCPALLGTITSRDKQLVF